MGEQTIHAVYYAKHEVAGPVERQWGSKLGRIVDRGYYVKLPDGSRFSISTIGLSFDIGSQEEVTAVNREIMRRSGSKAWVEYS